MNRTLLLGLLVIGIVVSAVVAQTTRSADAKLTGAKLRLHQISDSLIMYASENRGWLPERLTQAQPYLGKDNRSTLLGKTTLPEGFSSWSAEQQEQWVDDNTDIIYMRPTNHIGKASAMEKMRQRPILILHDPDNAAVIYIAYLGDRIESYRRIAEDE